MVQLCRRRLWKQLLAADGKSPAQCDALLIEREHVQRHVQSARWCSVVCYITVVVPVRGVVACTVDSSVLGCVFL